MKHIRRSTGHWRGQTNNLQCVFDVDWIDGLTLIELADGVTVDEIKSKTEAPFKVADDLKSMEA